MNLIFVGFGWTAANHESKHQIDAVPMLKKSNITFCFQFSVRHCPIGGNVVCQGSAYAEADAGSLIVYQCRFAILN